MTPSVHHSYSTPFSRHAILTFHFYLFFLKDRVSLGSPGWSKTPNPRAPSQMLELKARIIVPSSILFNFSIQMSLGVKEKFSSSSSYFVILKIQSDGGAMVAHTFNPESEAGESL